MVAQLKPILAMSFSLGDLTGGLVTLVRRLRPMRGDLS
jgi:hypothetical protein